MLIWNKMLADEQEFYHATDSYFGELKLGQAEWICPHCGQVIPRDKNVAINIKREGIRQFYTERLATSNAA